MLSTPVVHKKASLTPTHELASKVVWNQLRTIAFLEWHMLYKNLILLTCN